MHLLWICRFATRALTSSALWRSAAASAWSTLVTAVMGARTAGLEVELNADIHL